MRFPSFAAQAVAGDDAGTAADLRFAAEVAAGLGAHGGRVLAVGGYPRDLALARLGRAGGASKDLDLEVYGLELAALTERLAAFGRTGLVGASFGVAKLVNPATGTVLDVSASPMSLREGARRRT